MAVRDYFSSDYAEARRKFRDAATRAGAALAIVAAQVGANRAIPVDVGQPRAARPGGAGKRSADGLLEGVSEAALYLLDDLPDDRPRGLARALGNDRRERDDGGEREQS